MSLAKNSRFSDLGSGLVAEMVSDNIQIMYDPSTQGCRVIFTGHTYIKPGAKYLPVGMGSDLLDVDLSPYLLTCPVPESFGLIDPVTGINLSNVSLLGVVYYIKFVYDFFHNKRANETTSIDAGKGQPQTGLNPPNAEAPMLPLQLT